MKKYWYAMNNTPLDHIEIKTVNRSNNLYYLYFTKPNLNFNDTISGDGFSKNNKISQYQLHPSWTLYYQSYSFQHNNKAILQYMKDSLRQHNPKLTISNSRVNLSMKVLSIENLESNPYQLATKSEPYWLRIKVRGHLKANTPRHLYNVSMVVKSLVLSETRYEYGQCDIFGGFFNKCTTESYFKHGGGTFNTHYTDDYCQVFDLAKGSSHYKCSVDEGA